MSNTIRISALCVVLGFAAPSLAVAADKTIGQLEYENKCASCHGLNGKGDGILIQYLKIKPPSLTVLKKNNGGVFPADRVYQIIDGRLAVKGHGTSEMPIWGQEYIVEAQKGRDQSFVQAYGEQYLRIKILFLLEYISTLQE